MSQASGFYGKRRVMRTSARERRNKFTPIIRKVVATCHCVCQGTKVKSVYLPLIIRAEDSETRS